jgi:hypothetical protein
MKNGLELDNLGNKRYFLNDKLHREDGPAAEFVSGTKFWYQNNQRHRLDGPAIECSNGDKFWFINDERIFCDSQEEFLAMTNPKLGMFW